MRRDYICFHLPLSGISTRITSAKCCWRQLSLKKNKTHGLFTRKGKRKKLSVCKLYKKNQTTIAEHIWSTQVFFLFQIVRYLRRSRLVLAKHNERAVLSTMVALRRFLWNQTRSHDWWTIIVPILHWSTNSRWCTLGRNIINSISEKICCVTIKFFPAWMFFTFCLWQWDKTISQAQ